MGTFALLGAAWSYWSAVPAADKTALHFHHVSTDEVNASIAPGAPAFTEAQPYEPNGARTLRPLPLATTR